MQLLRVDEAFVPVDVCLLVASRDDLADYASRLLRRGMKVVEDVADTEQQDQESDECLVAIAAQACVSFTPRIHASSPLQVPHCIEAALHLLVNFGHHRSDSNRTISAATLVIVARTCYLVQTHQTTRCNDDGCAVWGMLV
jgi:hypothetical protein